MTYNLKEYKPTFDTPMRREQELAISRKIMYLLNKNKYNNLEEFISKNPNYQDFLKKNNMSNVVKHFGNTLKEEDYIKILENLRTLTKTKQDLEKSIIVNEQDNIMKIDKNNGQYYIVKVDSNVEKEETIQEKPYQKTLTPTPNNIYSK